MTAELGYSKIDPRSLYHLIFTYDPDTGIIRHNPDRPRATFQSDVGYKIWHTKYSDKPIIGRNSQGYITVSFTWFGVTSGHLAHRVALIMSGVDLLSGGLCVDHLNGIRDDNRLINLSAGTRLENQRNQGKSRANTSGAAGVYKSGTSWVAKIKIEGKSLHLGSYETFREAVAARKAAEIVCGFSEGHGIRLSYRIEE